MVDTHNDRHRMATLGLLMAAWLVMVVPMAAAQEVDSRWAPWIGCWRAMDGTEEPPLVCVVPLDGEVAIELLTVIDGQIVSRESIIADGLQHIVSREGCEGVERAEFSSDSHRIYVRSELTCGVGGLRSSTGVISMISPSEWLEVRTMDADGQRVPWVLRYVQASRADYRAAGREDLIDAQGVNARMARLAASVPIATKDVIEAIEKVSAETVQVWVVEHAEPFALDAGKLIEMADAGVPASVIDVVVAVSYPEKFVVNQGDPLGLPQAGAGQGGSASAYGAGLNPFEDPFYDPYARYGYSPYGYGSRYSISVGYYGRYGYPYGGFGGYGGFGFGYGTYPGYGGFGFGYGPYPGYGGWGYGIGAPIVIVDRRTGGTGGINGGTSSSGSTRGRVVRGGGYTSADSGGGSAGRSARPRSGSSASSGSASSRAPSGGSSAASAPRSSGSSPQSTGRRAMPRPPGN